MKNSVKTILTFSLCVFLLSACSTNRFVSSNFDETTKTHQKIAVVPVKMTFTGNIPDNLSDADVIAIEEAESLEFQKSVRTGIQRSTRRGRKPLSVELQSTRQTNAILEEAGISIRESWTMDPSELAEILGVDAVVSTNIAKERFLSREASYAIGTGIQILRGIGGLEGVPAPRSVTKTYEINVDVAAIDGKSGETLYANRDVVAINWSCTSEQAIEKVNRRLTRRFPYSR